MTDHHLRGRRILVTGGSSGIGQAIVRAYVGAGADVVAVGRDPRALDQTLSGLDPARVMAVEADLTQDAGRRSVADAVEHRTGALDVVVHAAGALGPVRSAEARLA